MRLDPLPGRIGSKFLQRDALLPRFRKREIIELRAPAVPKTFPLHVDPLVRADLGHGREEALHILAHALQ